MPEGTIMKAISGFYYVKNEDRMIQCRARGIFRKQKITPLVGDHVVYEATNPSEGYILSIHERKNELIRPPIANVDQLLLVCSVAEPSLDRRLLDRFLVQAELRGLPSVICLTKCDLATEQTTATIDRLKKVYRDIGYPVLVTSSVNGRGIQDIRDRLSGKISVVTGQSGVGKSSLLNTIDSRLQIDTQTISRSLGRGRHTTRHVELFPVAGSGYAADTPGFSSLDIPDIPAEALARCFPEFDRYRPSCRFSGCTHISEPGCSVKAAVEQQRIDRHRYQHYCDFFQEIKQRKRRY